ncbi:MAG: hypothetical protein K1X67_07995 [Fimbriimonadaceae bacterium]|nr:hypothetical protein [Fimbriimonadaceae bacterium]
MALAATSSSAESDLCRPAEDVTSSRRRREKQLGGLKDDPARYVALRLVTRATGLMRCANVGVKASDG